MKSASNKAYIPISKLSELRAKMRPGATPGAPVHGVHLEESKELDKVAPNIFSLSMGCLAVPMVYATGDSTCCPSCKAIFNIYSKNHLTQEATGTYWVCEFCSTKTKLSLDPQEYPTSETATYVLEVAAQPVVAETKTAEGITAIFCIDVSGSMNKRKRLTGMPKMTKYMTKANEVSRLEALKMAIDSQIQKLVKEDPQTKVGFVTFANDVSLMGDGSQQPYIMPRENLNDFYNLIELTGNIHDQYMSLPVSTAQQALLTKLAQIRTEGDTALGPALVVGIGLAARGAVGSRVIICTDGLANRGLGQIKTGTREETEETRKFYTQVGEYAQQHGIVVSVISLVESECRLDLLSPIANLTAGDILRVDPMRPHADFSACLSEKVLATGVKVRVKLHRALEFVRAPEASISADRSVYTQQLGNVTRDSGITFEYGLKSLSALAAMSDLDLGKQTVFPFQAQIEFKEPSGKKCLRVITQTQEFTEKLEEANQGVQVEVIKSHAIRTTAQIAGTGALDEAMVNMRRWGHLAPDAKHRAAYERSTAGLTKAIAMQKVAPMGKAAPQLDVLTIALNSANQQRAMPMPMTDIPEDMKEGRMPTAPAPKSAVPIQRPTQSLGQFPMPMPMPKPTQQSKAKKYAQ